MKNRWHWALVIVVGVTAVAAAKAYTLRTSFGTTMPAAQAQDVGFLDRRINLLEQRFYSIESRLNRLEQQMSMAQRVVPTPSQPMRDPDVDVLRNDSESLKARVRELECGILRLDERTLPEGTKDTRRRTGAQPKDPCRVNPETPIKLSVRP